MGNKQTLVLNMDPYIFFIHVKHFYLGRFS